MREGKIIIIEGYDGTGKTTLCKRLVEEFDGVYFHCPSGKKPLTKGMYDLFKDYNDMDETTKLFMILATHVENIQTMNELKATGEVVIADRSLLSTYAYQHINYENFNEILNRVDFPTLNVDDALILTASIETLQERLLGRSDNDNLDVYFMTNLERIMTKYHEHYLDIYPFAHQISTSRKTEEEVYKHALRVLTNKTRPI